MKKLLCALGPLVFLQNKSLRNKFSLFLRTKLYVYRHSIVKINGIILLLVVVLGLLYGMILRQVKDYY